MSHIVGKLFSRAINLIKSNHQTFKFVGFHWSGQHCYFLYHPPKKFKSTAVHRYYKSEVLWLPIRSGNLERSSKKKSEVLNDHDWEIRSKKVT